MNCRYTERPTETGKRSQYACLLMSQPEKVKSTRCKLELNQRNARLAELEQVLKEQESVMAALRKKVSDALLGFENQGLNHFTEKR